MVKPPPKIEFALEGADPIVDFADFQAFCATVLDCLKRTEVVVTGRRDQVAYKVSNLAVGSATVTLQLVRSPRARGRDQRNQVAGLFSRTVETIQRGGQVDSRFGIEDLSAFKRLARPLSRRGNSVCINGVCLTEDFTTHADSILDDTVPTEGFVTGRIEKLNLHGRSEFTLFPAIPGYRIACRFPIEMLDEVRVAIHRTVTVYGRMNYAPGSPFPRTVIVRSLEIHPPDDQLPRLEHLRGTGAGCTNGMTAVEYVRRLRDE